jgi:membrane protein DedA with SNARE-associated domain
MWGPPVLELAVHVHLFHHVRGGAVDYVGVALAAFASWVGVPGPGEPVLIAAAVFAAKHKLDITPLIFWAWVGATVGGVVGWLVGMKAGRRLLTAPGPFQPFRRRMVERGERVFRRLEVVAIVFTPSWVAGVHGSRACVYLPTNAISALALWALPIALGAYYAGPPLLELVNDLGTVATVVLGVAVGGILAAELARRWRARGRAASG